MTNDIKRCEALRGERRCLRAVGHTGLHYHRCNRTTYKWDGTRAFVIEPYREPTESIRPCTCCSTQQSLGDG